MKRKIATVVVTYNRKELLQQNLNALLQQTVRDSMDIIVIDNASSDGTYEEIKNYVDCNEVIYINTGKNLGGAGGFQYGIQFAAGKGYEFLWLMDDDSIPDKYALSELINAAIELDNNFGFLSSVVYWTDGQLCNMNIQKKNLIRKISLNDENFTKIVMATFVSLFIKVETVQKVGLPIKEFFIWSDDFEYTRRISKKYDCYLVTESKVVHAMLHNRKVNIVNDTMDRISRYKLLYRNEMYIYRREGLVGIAYFILRVAYHLFKIMISKSDNKKEKMSVILTSVKEGISFNPPIEYL